MPLRDILHKKDKINQAHADAAAQGQSLRPPPEFKFLRTTTNSEEIIAPPTFPGDSSLDKPTKARKSVGGYSLGPLTKGANRRTSGEGATQNHNGGWGVSPTLSPKLDHAPHSKSEENVSPGSPGNGAASKTRRLSNLLKHGKDKDREKEESDYPSPTALQPDSPTSSRPRNERRLSSRLNDALHISSHSRNRSRSNTASAHVPTDLPEIQIKPADAKDAHDRKSTDDEAEREREAQWEKRATLLADAEGNRRSRSRSLGNEGRPGDGFAGGDGSGNGVGKKANVDEAKGRARAVSDVEGDNTLQEAIRLHESDDLTRATQLFSQLASPTGTNNALAQVLYGLSLRHGWGCTPDPDLSLSYLTQAAANAGAIERAALQSGKERGGAAKGELVLAIFELGNSFRYGWGTAHDPVAARSYYECAAELGDVDAMGEAAWCFVDGFGGPKDKFKAAMYLRRAEGKGRVGVGESWIWKPKYDPKPS